MVDFNKIPDWWPLCPGFDCPQKETCLRHVAYTQAPQGVTRWTCVLPQALTDGTCSYYRKDERVLMARGFSKLFDQLHSRDLRHDIRIALTDYFNSKGSYYRYRNGEQLLSPEQQQEVRRIVSQKGFDDDFDFDEYIECFDFTSL